MKRLVPLLFAVSLFGCGGGGSSPIVPTINPFAGSYSGSYNDSLITSPGTTTFTVANSGVVNGTLSDSTDGNGTFTGTISNYGLVNGSFSYPSIGTNTVSGTLTLSGTALSGTLSETVRGQIYQITVSATKA